MLSFMVTWGKSRSHIYKGNRGSTVHRESIKCFLKLIKALSAAFIQCMCGGTSWDCISESSKYCLKSSDTSLSLMWSFGVNPRFLNLALLFVIPFRIQGPVVFLSGVVIILLS